MFRTLTIVTFALALAACVDDNADSGLTLLRNIAPAAGCVVSPDSTDFLPSGTIQADAQRGYFFTPVARNDLAVVQGESETNKLIFIAGAHVTIDFFDPDFFTKDEQATLDADGVTRFAVPSSGAIDPDGGTATFGFEIVPTELLAMIAAKLPAPSPGDPFPSTLLNVSVQLYGTRAGSSTESNVFHYPVEVCDGCIVHDAGPCAALPDGFTASPGGACNVLQDTQLDCCTDDAGNQVCPAAAPSTQS
jgi:hypothetical protein